MYKRVWALSVAMPVLMLVMPFLTSTNKQVTNSQITSAQTQIAQKPVMFAATVDAPNPNDIMDLVNKTRKDKGLAPFVADEHLGELAAARAEDMAKRQYYAHRNPDGEYYYDLLRSYGIDSNYSCENLDLTFSPNISKFINDWTVSTKGHRECLLTEGNLKAGYATKKFTLVQYGGIETTAYVVVAIHSEPNLNSIPK